MKKALIIGGIIFLLLLTSLGAWAYLLYTGTTATDVAAPVEGNPFAEGAFRTDTGERDGAVVTPPRGDGPEMLRQLSMRKVIGAVLMSGNDGTFVRFAEAGTGHLYEIAMGGGVDMRISNTTFPKAKDAVWSPQGTRVVVIREEEGVDVAYLGAIEKGDDGTTSLVGDVLPASAHSFGFNGTGDTFYYAVRAESGTKGYARDLKTDKERMVFDIPLREVTVAWDPSPLIVTKASGKLMGYAYQSDLSRIGEGTLGLRAIGDSMGYALGGTTGSELTGVLIGTTTIALDRGIAPDKCTLTSTQLVCGIPKSLDASDFPDEWYRGQVTYDDTIYTFNRTTGVSTIVSDPMNEARREIDIARFEESASDGELLFTTKNDRTLWMLSL